MTVLPRKADVLAALRAKLRADLDEAIAQQKTAHEGATHEESRAENDKDTRGLETSYLARGLAKRVAELQQTADAVGRLPPSALGPDDVMRVGGLCLLEDDDGEAVCFLLAPAGGGIKIDVDGARVRVVTPSAPLGKALVGKGLDDDVEVKTPKGATEYVLVALA